MNDYITEKNRRQYQRMLDGLAEDTYDGSATSLGSLIATLEFLLAAIEGVDYDWRNRFQTHCGILDEVNAYVLDCGRKGFSDDERTILKREVDELKRLIGEVYVPD